MLAFLAQSCIGYGIVGLHVMALDLLEDFVSAAYVFVLDVNYWIDEMLVFQGTETVLPAEPGKDCGIVEGSLAVQIEFCSPPRCGTVFKLHPEGMKVVATVLSAEGGIVFDLKISWFFQIVVVGHYVRILLAPERRSHDGKSNKE